jgi:hypothetical protein
MVMSIDLVIPCWAYLVALRSSLAELSPERLRLCVHCALAVARPALTHHVYTYETNGASRAAFIGLLGSALKCTIVRSRARESSAKWALKRLAAAAAANIAYSIYSLS